MTWRGGPPQPHTVTRKARTANGTKSDPTYGTASTFRARVEKVDALVRLRNGKEIFVRHQMGTTTQISKGEVYWFPSVGGEAADDTGDLNAARAPQEIEFATDGRGRRTIWMAYF